MKEIILGDGGMGSELSMRGVEVPSHVDSIWSALALSESSKIIKEIHSDYIEAGSDYITINNYAVTQPILARNEKSDQLEDLTLKAISLAKEAVKESGKEVDIAGSLPPLETSYRADLILPEQQMLEYYSEIAGILEGQVDIIICETMASSSEARCALKSIQNSNSKRWVSWTLHGNRMNTLPSGEDIESAFLNLTDLEADAYLINCCGANFVGEAIKKLSALSNKPIGGYANSENITTSTKSSSTITNAEDIQKLFKSELNEEKYSSEVMNWINSGASIVGGCCRTRPSYIKRLKEILK